MVLAWLPFSDSRNYPCDSPVRAVASVGEVNPHLHGIVLQECWGASEQGALDGERAHRGSSGVVGGGIGLRHRATKTGALSLP